MRAERLNAVADRILEVQLSIAWAGEALAEPPRLGWWRTDLVDEAGGGDFLKRLVPRTYAWAGLELAREAARRVDEQTRMKMADRDAIRTMFHLGFDWDERIGERLGEHKASGIAPQEALPALFAGDRFDERKLADWIRSLEGEGAHTVAPGGRQLKGKPPDDPDRLVRNLAAALLPFPEAYPLPFYRVS